MNNCSNQSGSTLDIDEEDIYTELKKLRALASEFRQELSRIQKGEERLYDADTYMKLLQHVQHRIKDTYDALETMRA